MRHDTAGDPITGVKWSRRTTRKIAAQLAALGIAVSKNTVGRLLKNMDCKLCVNRQQIASTKNPDSWSRWRRTQESASGRPGTRPIIAMILASMRDRARRRPSQAKDIYTFGAEGVLQALDFSAGKRLWSVDTRQKFDAPKGFFGAACSPLVDDGRVLMNIGGPNGAGIVAFDAATGKVC
jgi:outer membrane protein assembly factor BamB